MRIVSAVSLIKGKKEKASWCLLQDSGGQPEELALELNVVLIRISYSGWWEHNAEDSEDCNHDVTLNSSSFHNFFHLLLHLKCTALLLKFIFIFFFFFCVINSETFIIWFMMFFSSSEMHFFLHILIFDIKIFFKIILVKIFMIFTILFIVFYLYQLVFVIALYFYCLIKMLSIKKRNLFSCIFYDQ